MSTKCLVYTTKALFRYSELKSKVFRSTVCPQNYSDNVSMSHFQYDELDALFTQFVLNSNLSDSPTWLNPFASDLNNWSGVSLRPHGLINKRLRAKMVARKPSLIDVRNYMFSRQSVMLLKLGRPWEVARRCLPFLLNVIQELEILEVPSKPGMLHIKPSVKLLFSPYQIAKNGWQATLFCFYSDNLKDPQANSPPVYSVDLGFVEIPLFE